MKLRILLVTVLAFALSAPAALAHDGGGDKHAKAHARAEAKKANKKNADCRPRVGLVARGSLVSVGDGGFTMNFEMGNRHAKRLAKYYGEELYFTVKNEKRIWLRLKGHGKLGLEELAAKLADEAGGDYTVLVKARLCKRYLRHADTLSETTTPELYAKWVKVRVVKPKTDKAEGSDEEAQTDGDETAA